jgi:hypothetical protein
VAPTIIGGQEAQQSLASAETSSVRGRRPASSAKATTILGDDRVEIPATVVHSGLPGHQPKQFVCPAKRGRKALLPRELRDGSFSWTCKEVDMTTTTDGREVTWAFVQHEHRELLAGIDRIHVEREEHSLTPLLEGVAQQ